jgi:dTDP-4-dehydrorhamnose reductase
MDFLAVEALYRKENPGCIVHCAALSRVQDCHADPELAHKLNVEATAFLAGLFADLPFVFLSTDLVFDGLEGNYDESAKVNPPTEYGRSKAAAELVVLANARHTVVRTSLNAGDSPTGDRAFNEQLIRAWKKGEVVRLFTDEFRSPILVEHTARAIWELLAEDKPGLYHVAGSQRLSRWEIGKLVAARHPKLSPGIQPVSLKDFPGPPRSPDTSLNCGKAQRLLSFLLPAFSKSVEENWLSAGTGNAIAV